MRLIRFKASIRFVAGTFALSALAQQVDVVSVRSELIERTTVLPGEIVPYQRVKLYARANGFVDRVFVDRGSVVRQGQQLVTVLAPELAADIAEAQSRVDSLESAQAEAEARLGATQETANRLKRAAETPGAIAGNEMVQAEKTVDVARAALRSAEAAVRSAKSAVEAKTQAQAYLNVTGPFDGVVTERYVHPGALVGPGNGSAEALLELQQISRLRLVVAVPEAQTAAVRTGMRVSFRVPAYPQRMFKGTVARISHSLDPKTRSMPIELDVANPLGELAPGMYPEVDWPTSGAGVSLVVPATAIVTTTERTFVIRMRNGRAEWVDVRRGSVTANGVEVMGAIAANDLVVRRGTDEIREGTQIDARVSR